MWTKQHAIISFLATVLAAPLAYGSVLQEVSAFGILFIFPLGVAAGTLIDLDHFLISRYRTGNWLDTKKVIEEPKYFWENPEEIFGSHAVKETDRYLTHLIIIGTLNMIYVILGNGYLAASFNFAAIIMSIHMVCDLYADTKNQYRKYEEEISGFLKLLKEEI